MKRRSPQMALEIMESKFERVALGLYGLKELSDEATN